MSAEELSKLSLADKMVTTRAGAARARTGPQQEAQPQSPQSTSSVPPPPSPTPLPPPSPTASLSPIPSLIESTSEVTYNVGAFDTEVRRRAKKGLMDENEIKVKYCMVSGDESPQYVFSLGDEIHLVIGGHYKVPRCTCGANEGGNACKHIFWMLDQLTSLAPDKFKSQTLQVSKDGSAVQDMKPAEMIDKIGFEGITDHLGWVVHDGPRPEAEEIEDEVAAILSVFEPENALPEEFKTPDSPSLSERARKFREFKDLITQYAKEDLGLFGRLQDVIDLEFQAQIFFEKINSRIDHAFEALDEYIRYGPTAGSSEVYDVENCAKTLKALVKAIGDYYRQQEEDSDDAKDIGIRAAAALVKTLDRVTSRNHDAYATITWGGMPSEDPRQNNLFVNLIGAPSEGDELFVLDVLQSIPHEDIVRNHWDNLLHIGGRLRLQWTPQAYMDMFRSITTESRKRAGSDVEGSSSKRPMQ